MRLAPRGAAFGYAIAVAGLVALVLLHGITGRPASADVMLFGFLAVIALAGWVGGFGPALAGTILATAFRVYFTLPRGSFDLASPADRGRALMLVGTGCLIALMARWAHDRGRLAATEAGRLRASEERFRLASEAVQGIIYDLDIAAGRFWASEGLPRILGLPAHREEYSHEWWVERMHPDDRARIQQDVVQMRAGAEATWTGRYRIRHEDGHWVHLWDSARLLRDERGSLVRVLGYSVDVSALYAAEAARRASELRLQLAVEALGLASWDFDLVSGEMAWSDSHFELWGLDRERDGAPSLELWRRHVHPDDLPRMTDAVATAMSTGLPYACTYRIRRPDTGEERVVTARGRTIAADDGRLTRFVGVVFDITEQARAQEELRQKVEEFERLLEVLPAAVWYAHDAECRVVSANAAAYRITPGADGVNASADGVERRGWRRALQNGRELSTSELPLRVATAQASAVSMEFAFERTDGRVIDLLGGAAPLFGADGRVRGGVAAFVDISERKRVECERDEACRLFERIADTTPGILYLYDLVDQRNVYASRGLMTVLGYEPARMAELGEQLAARLVHPDDWDAAGPALEGAAGGIRELELRMRHADGTCRWLRCRETVFSRDDDGRPRLLLGIAHDVTEEKATLEALRSSESRLRQLAEVVPQIVFITRPDGSLEYVNRQWELATGSRPTTDGAVYDQVHPDDRGPMLDSWAVSRARETPYATEFRLRMADDSYRWFLSRALPIHDEHGRLVRWYGTSTDIDANKRAQSALEYAGARQRALADAALRINASLSVAQPLDATVQLVAELGRGILGVHQATLVVAENGVPGTHAVSLSDKHAGWRGDEGPVAGRGMHRLVMASNRAMRLTQDELEAHPGFSRALGAAPVHPPLRGWLAVPLVGRDGHNLGVLQFSDRTDGGDFSADDEAVAMQMAANAAVAIENWELVQQIRETDRRKDEFLATLAHELRNPLAPIGNSIEMLRRAAADPAIVTRVRDTMERQMGHLVHLVDDLLDASRITSGKLSLRREPVALVTVLLQAVETARPLLERAGQTLDLHLPAEPAWLDADATRLTQVFSNLLNNASKFGGQEMVTVAAAVERGRAVVRVHDRGVGIPRHRLGDIFEMFSQVDRGPDRLSGGLGIGLALVKRLVEMHGGRVEASSEGEGRGSTFTVTLPTIPAPGSQVSEGGAVVERPSARRILVADDNRDSADSMAALLRLSGHETSVAYDGEEAVALATRTQPDVVLLDLGMPRLDGHEAAQQIRHCLGPDVLLIAVTGWGDEQSRQRTREAGFDAHLTKPVDLPRLLALLGPQ